MALNEPRALCVTILNQIIADIKQSRPIRLDGQSVVSGYVFCGLTPGLMINPRDYHAPYDPETGFTVPDTPGQSEEEKAKLKKARDRSTSAYINTLNLTDEMLLITTDGTTAQYTGGRSLEFTYKSIVDSLEADDPPLQTSAAAQKLIDDAAKVLYKEGGDKLENTVMFATYLANQKAYADARIALTNERNKILDDPSRAGSVGILLIPFQNDVNNALRRWRSQGAAEVEAALAIQGSQGIPLTSAAVSSVKERLTTYTPAVPGQLGGFRPYSFVLPSDWSNLDVDDIGWTTLSLNKRNYESHVAKNGYRLSTGNWSGSSSSLDTDTSISAGPFLDAGFGYTRRYSRGSVASQSAFSQQSEDKETFTDDASEISIELQYGLCKIVRPWFAPDIFRLGNWYLKGQKAGSISDGTILGQVLKQDGVPALPMVITNFLVIRKVVIEAKNWGSIRKTLETSWANQNKADSSRTNQSNDDIGLRIPVLSWMSLEGGASRKDSSYVGDFYDESGKAYSNDHLAYFEGNKLIINGAQIVGWLGEVLPFCPPKSDPNLTS